MTAHCNDDGDLGSGGGGKLGSKPTPDLELWQNKHPAVMSCSFRKICILLVMDDLIKLRCSHIDEIR